MNNFRASILTGDSVKPHLSLLGEKKPRGAQTDALDSIPVIREATRSADHRDDDRHRLAAERAEIRFRGQSLDVELINLSGGGAMIRGDLLPQLWERVDLILGEHGSVECAVRWIKGDRVGLEFAHETRVDGDPSARDAMLLDAIRRSFPDIDHEPPAPVAAEPVAEAPADIDAARRAEPRHPLIWSGTVLFAHDTHLVRLRNISPNGALIESTLAFPAGEEVYLDLGGGGSLFATVSWARGDQVGLRFAAPFDIANLAKARPEIAPQRWSHPQYLRDDQAGNSPWAEPWRRLSVAQMKASLEGKLKR